MILKIINEDIKPMSQVGKIVNFKRRKPDQSNLLNISNLTQIYDYIRMLDCDGYPPAFIENYKIRYEFSNAKLDKNNQIISAYVRISKK